MDYGRFGVFGGGAISEADTEFNAQNVDVDSLFAGVAWRPEFGGMDLQLALAAGTANHDLTRRVANNTVPGGVEIANAKFDGWFIAPAVTISSPFNLANRAVVGRVRLNYTALFLDGYTETGTATPLSVSSRTAHQLGTHAELSFPTTWRNANGKQVRAEWNIGLESNFNPSANDVSGNLAGTAISFDGSADDRVSGFVGASYAGISTNGLRKIAASIEAQISGAGGYKLSTGLTAGWAF